MITVLDNVFFIETRKTAYWFQVTEHGHLEHLYYGPYLPAQNPAGLRLKRTAQIGSTVAYTDDDPLYSLDVLPLEYSGQGKGDFRFSPSEIQMPDGSYVTDFVYHSHVLTPGTLPSETLPTAHGSDPSIESLTLILLDKSNQVELRLHYTVFPSSDVITRRVSVSNQAETPLVLERLLSFSLDLPNRNYALHTFDGGWIKEAHHQEKPLAVGKYLNQSSTGASSNQHNPGFILAEKQATEDHGWTFGFNLVYSGNHFSCVERTSHDLVRVTAGLSPENFHWTLAPGESFETPESIMTFSDAGFNGVSQHFHQFINQQLIPPGFQAKARPIAYNNWEATFMDFNERKLLGLAKEAKQLGMELFVLDDGWFGARDDDTKGLGDYQLNQKKFKKDLPTFVQKINDLGLEFGLWFEPEMVNEDSELYRNHPEYAIKVPGKRPAYGRNQLVLDLCQPAVRDYIVTEVSRVLDSANITYVKWDMNRHLSDMYSPSLTEQGRFFHSYILGLYDVLRRIFTPRPQILLETCASGGNRFDLGMLAFGPQIWSSDNTDPIERLKIQGGLSYLYPLSSLSCHVSSAPHQQTLRDTPLSTRFNVASFGVLGYELDLDLLSLQEKKEIKEQIAFYKTHRQTLQYGTFSRQAVYREHLTQWQVLANNQGVAGFFQRHADAAMGFDRLTITGLDETKHYTVTSKPQRLMIERFGELVKHVAPVKLNPHGLIFQTVNKVYSLQDSSERYQGTGRLFSSGVLLHQQFVGSHYNEKTRLLGDYGSTLYTIQADREETDDTIIRDSKN